MSNPPFGSNVKSSDIVRDSDYQIDRDAQRRYEQEYGSLYRDALARLEGAEGDPIASLFDMGGGGKGKVKTEVLFIERCLSLLKPGGRLGIVLPEGIF